MDQLDRKLVAAYDGKVVRKDLLHRVKKGTNVPTFVLEFLLARYCASDEPAEMQAGIEAVLATLADNYVRPDEANAAQSKVATKGKHRFIDKVHVRYVEKEKRHWAALDNFNSQRIAIAETFYRDNQRLLEGGIWAEVTVAYNEIDDDDYAFYIEDLRPIQLSRFDFEAYAESRRGFSRDEWLDVVLRSVGLEPSKIGDRLKLHFIARLATLAEPNFNFIELGPRGTGKSYFFSEFSPYSTLVSGGQSAKAVLFYNNQRKRVGLVGFWDTVAFDEVAGVRINDPGTIQIMKDYMANGRFSRGVEVIADASMAFVGNIDHSIEQLVNSEEHDLFMPLPKEFDLAIMDRFACYLPGWEMPKNSSEFLTDNYGFITDYLAEAFHHQFSRTNRYEEVTKRIRLGRCVEGRDEKGIKKTVCAFSNILHPDGPPSDAEFEEYVAYAVECRRRVKEQMNKRKPDDEFAKIDLSYFNSNGQEVVVYCPESKQSAATQTPSRKGLAGAPSTKNGDQAPEPQSEVTGDQPTTNAPAGDSDSDPQANVIESFHAYDLLRSFSAGGMAEAYMARNRQSGETVFLKRVRNNSADKDALDREVRIYQKLMRLRMPHVLQVLDFVRDEQFTALVTEFADGGDLKTYVAAHGNSGGLPVEEAKEVAVSVALALKELHSQEIVHRDLKPENVLRAAGCWKLADFGISKNLTQILTQRTFQHYGTLGYAAPEQFDGVEARPSADVYSLGKLVVFLLTGQSDVDVVRYPVWRELLRRMVNSDPKRRPPIDQALDDLQAMPA